jgi:hypothetical protein
MLKAFHASSRLPAGPEKLQVAQPKKPKNFTTQKHTKSSAAAIHDKTPSIKKKWP